MLPYTKKEINALLPTLSYFSKWYYLSGFAGMIQRQSRLRCFQYIICNDGTLWEFDCGYGDAVPEWIYKQDYFAAIDCEDVLRDWLNFEITREGAVVEIQRRVNAAANRKGETA